MRWTRRVMVALVMSALALTTGALAFTWASANLTEANVSPAGDRLAALAAPDVWMSGIPQPAVISPAPATSSSPAVPSTPSVVASLPVPVRIEIPAIDVDTEIVPVGLDAQRNLEIPADIATVGWYELGVAPGSATGSVVMVAHRDGRVDGHGVFYDLGRLDVGNRIAVTNAAGDRLTYRVVAREQLPVRDFAADAEAFFAIDGPPRLTLITCGGYYSRDAGGYQANVIVTAVPVTPG